MIIRVHTSHLKQELLNPPVLIGGSTLAVLYILFSTLILNSRFISETVSGNFPFSEKALLILALLEGVTTIYSPFELVVIILMGFLMGVNVVLLIKSIREKNGQKGSMPLGIGFLGMVATTGCASCGITLLSFLGPSLSLGLLPFQGLALQSISLILLSVSLIYTLNRRSKACLIIK